jgi:hypothetical protein
MKFICIEPIKVKDLKTTRTISCKNGNQVDINIFNTYFHMLECWDSNLNDSINYALSQLEGTTNSVILVNAEIEYSCTQYNGKWFDHYKLNYAFVKTIKSKKQESTETETQETETEFIEG